MFGARISCCDVVVRRNEQTEMIFGGEVETEKKLEYEKEKAEAGGNDAMWIRWGQVMIR